MRQSPTQQGDRLRHAVRRQDHHDGVHGKAVAQRSVREVKNQRKNQHDHRVRKRFRVSGAIGKQRAEQTKQGQQDIQDDEELQVERTIGPGIDGAVADRQPIIHKSANVNRSVSMGCVRIKADACCCFSAM